MRGENALLGALIAEARPVGVQGEELTLAFGSAFLKKKAEDPANRMTVTEALRVVTGGRWRLSYELRADAPTEEGAPAGAQPESEERWLARFMEEFDAEEIPAEPERRRRRGAGGHEQRERPLMPKQPRMPNVQQMMQQVQKMQQDMAAVQEELKSETVQASAGGGMVTVTISGDLQVREVRIDPAAVDPEDVEMLGDMVLAAVNEALRAAQELVERQHGRSDRRPRPRRAGRPGHAGAVSTYQAPPVQRLVTELSKLPGVGDRTAQRLAFHLLRASPEDAAALAAAIVEVKEKIGLCEVCFNLTDEPRCRICEDPRRDKRLICVVEEPSDVIPMERTHEYHGVYHVLGGALSPIDGVDPEDLKIAELLARVQGADGVEEVVLATNPTTTGEATALFIAEELRRLAPAVRVTRLASGLPVGSDLEYADEVTLGKALAGRRAL